MADTVRYLMEEMVPELEDMHKKRYFSKQEIREIVKRRQDFEYKLKRKAALKEDFLRCVWRGEHRRRRRRAPPSHGVDGGRRRGRCRRRRGTACRRRRRWQVAPCTIN